MRRVIIKPLDKNKSNVCSWELMSIAENKLDELMHDSISLMCIEKDISDKFMAIVYEVMEGIVSIKSTLTLAKSLYEVEGMIDCPHSTLELKEELNK